MPVVTEQAFGEQGEHTTLIAGGQAWAVWQDLRARELDLFAARLSATGAPLDPTGLPVARVRGDPLAPRAAAAPFGLLVVWEDRRDDTGGDLYAARVAPDGRVLDPGGVALVSGAVDQRNPAVAGNGSQLLIVWQERLAGRWALRTARMDAAGAVAVAPAPILVGATGDSTSPAVAAAGTGWLLAWQDTRAGGQDVFAARLDAAGASLDGAGVRLSLGAGNESQAAVSCAARCLVAWANAGAGTVEAQEVDPAAAPAPIAPTAFTTAGTTSRVALAPGGVGALLTWVEGGTARWQAAWLGAGAAAQGGPFTLAASVPATGSVSGALLSAGTLVGVQHELGGPDGGLLQARSHAWTLGADGGTLSGGAPLTLRAAYHGEVNAAASWGGRHALFWMQKRPVEDEVDVRGVRLASDGTSLDVTPRLLSAPGSGWKSVPEAAAGSDRHLVVWTQVASGSDIDIRGSFLLVDGGATPDFAIATLGGTENWPAAHFTGNRFLASWFYFNGSRNESRYAEVTSAGVALPANGTVLSPQAQEQRYTHFSGQDSALLAAWQTGNGPFGLRTARVVGGTVTPAGLDIGEQLGVEPYPRMVETPAGFSVVFRDEEGPGASVVSLQRVALDGGLDGAKQRVAGPSAGVTFDRAYVAFDGVTHVVVWTELEPSVRRVVGRWLDDPAGQSVIMQGTAELSVVGVIATGPGEALVFYRDFDPSPDAMNVQTRVRRFTITASPDGGTLDAGPAGQDGGLLGPAHYTVACGCGTSGAGIWGVLGLLALGILGARPRRDSRRQRQLETGRTDP